MEIAKCRNIIEPRLCRNVHSILYLFKLTVRSNGSVILFKYRFLIAKKHRKPYHLLRNLLRRDFIELNEELIIFFFGD